MAARWIWTDDLGHGRNQWGLFRCSLGLDSRPTGGTLHLFADTRYRLLVNGEVVGHGPARFFPGFPEYDTWDLTAHLRTGENVVAVIVNSAGPATFHNAASIGGLIAWGTVRSADGATVEIASGPSWRALVSPAHISEMPRLSFALNWGECCDLSRLPVGWAEPGFDDSGWPAAVALANQAHWGELRPRSVAPLDESSQPLQQVRTWAGRPYDDADVYRLSPPIDAALLQPGRPRAAAWCWLHSPVAQGITLGAWWGRHWLNGEPLQPVKRPDRPWRQDLPVRLEAGWNSLLRVEPVYTAWHDWWEYQLTVPRGHGIVVAAHQDLEDEAWCLLGGPWAEAAVNETLWPLASPDDPPAELGPWQPWPRGCQPCLPHRDRAQLALGPLASADATASVWLFDAGGEYLGRPKLTFEAPAGTVVDVAYTERLRPDGSADLFCRHFVDMHDRCVAAGGGLETWQAFHPRGGRWLEVTAYAPPSSVTLHSVEITRATYRPPGGAGWFECSDPLLNDIWRLCADTLVACSEDAYLDCPWRERGLYSGDLLVQFMVNLPLFGDTALFRRCIGLFLQAQGENGLVPGGCQGLPPGRHSDYSAILVSCLAEYLRWSSDLDWIVAMRPRWELLLESLGALVDPATGLVDGSNMDAYIDLQHMDRRGINGALNAFFQRGLADGSELLRAVGDDGAAERWSSVAGALAATIRTSFWDAKQGVFTDRRPGDVPDATPSVAVNALALAFDIAAPDQRPSVVAWLGEALEHNFRVPEPQTNHDCNCTSYFAYYALAALARHGGEAGARAALEFIRLGWGRMLAAGAWTCWEYFVDGDGASRCHAWSAAPLWHLASDVLGVRFPESGNWDRVEVRPRLAGLEWARGAWAHPRGLVEVEVRGEEVTVRAPEGVEVTVG